MLGPTEEQKEMIWHRLKLAIRREQRRNRIHALAALLFGFAIGQWL